MTNKEVMQQALEALERADKDDFWREQRDAITALRTALEQQAEPVSGCACRWDHEDNRVVTCERHQGWLDVIAEWADRAREAEAKLKAAQPEQQAKPVALEVVYETIINWDEGGGKRSRRELAKRIVDLYTTPPQRQWVGLTHEDVRQCSRDVVAGGSENSVDRFAYAIESKLKERNRD